jgi:hypothetical protein
MARTVLEIKKIMTDKFISYPEIISLYGLDSSKTFEEQFSKVSPESILFYCVAFGIQLLDVLFDTHKAEITQIIENERFGSVGWYEQKALAYQHGRVLVDGYDYYDNSALTDDDILAEKIVKFASAREVENGNLILKLAKGVTGALEKLTPNELAGVQSYINKIKVAGVIITCISEDADMFKATLNVQYDALILDSAGKRLDGTNDQPILDAVNSYLSSIKFNGEYSNMRLEDSVQDVPGVIIIDIQTAFAKYSDFDYELIYSRYQPSSGFMSVDVDNFVINYVPYV